MAFYYFSIGKKTFARVETRSFTSAVEAGQYREQFGLVETSIKLCLFLDLIIIPLDKSVEQNSSLKEFQTTLCENKLDPHAVQRKNQIL
ncbi:MAG: hypothetical protein R2685_06260 [Candidatus Nitrosocosmicus sp.]|nr:hypothetical protein [Candidatus Nitrosocosmicus sp.]